MAKNPILPLYYNDIDRSTRDWTDEEFGAYMRLLMHQWDKGFLPKDYQRLTRIATSLSTTWATIKEKFVETPAGLQNAKMEEIRANRLVNSKKQSENVRKRYQTSTKPSTKKVPSYEYEHENEDETVIDKEIENFLVPEMQKIFKQHNPTYKENRQRDYKPLLSIAEFLMSQGKLEGTPAENKMNILQAWDPLCQVISKDKFYCTKTLSTISNQIQEITQIAIHGKSNGKPVYGSKERAKEYDRLFAERYGNGGSAAS